MLRRHGILLLVILASFIATAYAIALRDRLRYPDEREYVALADNVLAGRGYTADGIAPTAYRAPGFTFLVAAGLRCGVSGARGLNVICYMVAMLGVMGLSRRVGGRGAAAGAGVVALAYPLLLYTAGTLYPQTLAGALLVLAVLTAETARIRHSVVAAGGAGVLMGMMILTTPSAVFALAGLFVWMLCSLQKKRVALSVTVLICAAIVVAPWQLRNMNRFDQPFFVSTNGGINLLLGNSPNSSPNSGVNVDLSAYDAAGMNEVMRDRFYRQAAIDHARSHPWRTLRLYGLKFLNYFNFRNRMFVTSERSVLRDGVMLVTYGGLLLLVIARLLLIRRAPVVPVEKLVMGLYVANGAFAAIFFTRIRFRVPFDWLLTVIGGVALAQVVGAIVTRRLAAEPARRSKGS